MSNETIEVQENGLVQDLTQLPAKYRRTKLLDCSDIQIGRPGKLNKAIAQALTDKVAAGVTLTQAAKDVGIGLTTVYRWTDENESFRQSLTHARKHHAAALVDQSMALLEDTSRDIIDGPKGPVINNAQVHRDKARVELRLRLAGIYNPMYAQHKDGTTVNVQVNTTVDAPKQESRDEWLMRHRRISASEQSDDTMARQRSTTQPAALPSPGGTQVLGGSK